MADDYDDALTGYNEILATDMDGVKAELLEATEEPL